MNNQSQTHLDSYVIYCIINFLNKGDVFILYESCKYFMNFIDDHNILKKSPHSNQIATRFEMLNWAESHPSFRYTKNIIESAVKEDKIDIVRYLIRDKPYLKSENCYNDAVRNLNLRMIKLLNKHNFPKNEHAFVLASEIGSLRMIKLLDKYDFPHDIRFSNTCARLGRLKCLKWLIENHYIWDTCTFHHASKGGDLRIMKFLYSISSNDISKPWWDMRTFNIAVKYNNIEIIRFLIENGCHWRSIYNTDCAFENGNFDTLNELILKGCPISENVHNFLCDNNMYYDKILVL